MTNGVQAMCQLEPVTFQAARVVACRLEPGSIPTPLGRPFPRVVPSKTILAPAGALQQYGAYFDATREQTLSIPHSVRNIGVKLQQIEGQPALDPAAALRSV
jgi:hypothetical protein